jgi:hypothetical protein
MANVAEHVAESAVDGHGTIAESKSIDCAISAFNPYSYDFYGDDNTILESMDNSALNVTDRRMFMLSVENDAQAEVKLYERVDDGTWSVSTWRGDSVAEIRSKISDMLFRNKGVFCTGEQAKGIFGGLHVDFAPDGIVPAPVSARAAFAHPIRAYTKGGYGRASITCFC